MSKETSLAWSPGVIDRFNKVLDFIFYINGLNVMILLENKNVTIFDSCTKIILFWSYADPKVIFMCSENKADNKNNRIECISTRDDGESPVLDKNIILYQLICALAWSKPPLAV